MSSQQTPHEEPLPSAGSLDDSLAFLREGYGYGGRRFARLRADGFRTRLLGRPTVVMRGREAAEAFSAPDRMSRGSAIPASAMHLLQDEGSVQSLSGVAHRHRKRMFLELLEDEDAERLAERFAADWAEAVAAEAGRTVSLGELCSRVLTKSAVAWCGIPVRLVEVDRLAERLGAMVEHAGHVGPRNWLARARRRGVERWASEAVTASRTGRLAVPSDAPLSIVARQTGADGALLDAGTAAVGLLNLLRPIVAISRYLAFAAHALERHPRWRKALRTDAEARLDFAQEVRRWYPFFPGVLGTATAPFEWHGHRFEPGDRAMLDLYATDHDPAEWTRADDFEPGRFLGGTPGGPLVPQGAGDVARGHRCPGEGATVAVMTRFLALAAAEPAPYSVPAQDLRISLRRVPALPPGGLRVRLRG